MTEGISKEKLEEMLLIVQENKERYFSQNLWLFESDMLRRLISECTELDPWLPIDDNTPKDRSILLLWPQEIGGAMEGYWICDAWYCDMWELTGSLMSRQPTHYKLL